MKRGHRSLKVWEEAMNLVEQVYRATRVFPKDETFGLTSQMRRAAISVPANIAKVPHALVPANLRDSSLSPLHHCRSSIRISKSRTG